MYLPLRDLWGLESSFTWQLSQGRLLPFSKPMQNQSLKWWCYNCRAVTIVDGNEGCYHCRSRGCYHLTLEYQCLWIWGGNFCSGWAEHFHSQRRHWNFGAQYPQILPGYSWNNSMLSCVSNPQQNPIFPKQWPYFNAEHLRKLGVQISLKFNQLLFHFQPFQPRQENSLSFIHN